MFEKLTCKLKGHKTPYQVLEWAIPNKTAKVKCTRCEKIFYYDKNLGVRPWKNWAWVFRVEKEAYLKYLLQQEELRRKKQQEKQRQQTKPKVETQVQWWTVLGVNQTSKEPEVKSAYRKLVMQYHPDKGGNKEMFIKVQTAYEIYQNLK